MFDYAIRNGLVVDGTGAPGRRADVGVRAGKIVALGEVTEEATTEFDAVEHDVVMLAADFFRIGLEQRNVLRHRRGERMMA